jgi:hypothetical protein
VRASITAVNTFGGQETTHFPGNASAGTGYVVAPEAILGRPTHVIPYSSVVFSVSRCSQQWREHAPYGTHLMCVVLLLQASWHNPVFPPE